MGAFSQVTCLSNKKIIKAAIRRTCADLFYYSGWPRLLYKGKTIILMYHRVLKDDGDFSFIQPGMYVTESVFESHMKYISNHFTMISMNDLLLSSQKNRLDRKNKYCIVTFDDGWLDNYSNAYPILKRYRVPATIFLTTSFIGTDKWFWPDKVNYLLIMKYQEILKYLVRIDGVKGVDGDILKSIQSIIRQKSGYEMEGLIDSIIGMLKSFPDEEIEILLDALYKSVNLSFPTSSYLLTWDMVREMSDDLISFGSHTCSHKILPQVTSKEAKNELEHSMQTLVEKNISYIPVLAYPNGNYNQEIINIAKECGYKAAVTTKYGMLNINDSVHYEISRIGIHNDPTLTTSLFSFHLSGLALRR